jgi:hypothetical protein
MKDRKANVGNLPAVTAYQAGVMNVGIAIIYHF